VKKLRAAAFAAAAIALVTAILAIPTPLRIQGTLVLRLAKPEEIYAQVEGRLVEMSVKNGEWVKKDTVLAKLENPQKLKELSERQQDCDINWFKARWFAQGPEREDRAQSKQHQEFAEKLEKVIAEIHSNIGKLTLISGRDGQVIGAPHRERVGEWLKPGKAFCEIGDPHHLEAHLLMDQSDIHLFGVDSEVWVKVYGKSEVTYKSKVSEIARRNRDEVPTEMSNLAGGEIASKPDKKTGSAKPITPVYEVIIPLENPDLLLQPGQRGFAKIDGGTHTLAWWLWRWCYAKFNFKL
jgi:putative peptide zinc metalloprotease protein